MESSFGENFGSVRVHTSWQAAQSARVMNAAAYTVGEDIVLGAKNSRLEGVGRHRLLTHELAHVIQQRRAGECRNGMVGSPTDHYEADADRAVEAADAGMKIEVVAGGTPPRIQLMPDDGQKLKPKPGPSKVHRPGRIISERVAPDGRVIDIEIGNSVRRMGLEQTLPSGTEVNLEGWQRAHQVGPGFGAESGEGIRYAPPEVNLQYQNSGIEKFIRDFNQERAPNARLYVRTLTETHPNSLRLKSITYRLSAARGKSTPQPLFEVRIEIENKRKNPRVTLDHPEMLRDWKEFLAPGKTTRVKSGGPAEKPTPGAGSKSPTGRIERIAEHPEVGPATAIGRKTAATAGEGRIPVPQEGPPPVQKVKSSSIPTPEGIKPEVQVQKRPGASQTASRTTLEGDIEQPRKIRAASSSAEKKGTVVAEEHRGPARPASRRRGGVGQPSHIVEAGPHPLEGVLGAVDDAVTTASLILDRIEKTEAMQSGKPFSKEEGIIFHKDYAKEVEHAINSVKAEFPESDRIWNDIFHHLHNEAALYPAARAWLLSDKGVAALLTKNRKELAEMHEHLLTVYRYIGGLERIQTELEPRLIRLKTLRSKVDKRLTVLADMTKKAEELRDHAVFETFVFMLWEVVDKFDAASHDLGLLENEIVSKQRAYEQLKTRAAQDLNEAKAIYKYWQPGFRTLSGAGLMSLPLDESPAKK